MEFDKKGREINDFVVDSKRFSKELDKYFNWYSGVPDSVLKNTQSHLSNFHFSTRENHSISMAFGALIGGKKPCILIQNSGLGLSIDAILGLFKLYKKGLVLIISNRGELDWEEVQHEDWGSTTVKLLNTFDFKIIDFQKEKLNSIQKAYEAAYDDNEIVAILVHRGNLDE